MTSVTTDQRLGVNADQAVKVPCAAASTSNLTLSGEQTVDGVALVTGDRMLATGQTTGSENGIWVVDTGAWTRPPDWDGANDVIYGTIIFITGGTSNIGYWQVSTTGTITPDTTSVSLSQTVPGAYSSTLLIYAQTATEIAQSVTPTYYYYPSGNPLRMGAAGDGVTNDTTPILNALKGAGGEVVDLQGLSYLVDNIVYTGNVHLINGTLISNTLTDHVLELSGSNILIDNVTLTSSFSGTGSITYASYYGIYCDKGEAAGSFTTDSKCIIKNCKIIDYQNVGAYIAGYDFYEFKDNIIDNLGAEGMRSDSCNNVTITGNTVRSVYGGGLQTGSGAGTLESAIIIGNRVNDVNPGNETFQADANDHGIAIEINSIYEYCTVSNNNIQKPHSMGISFSSASSAAITGNTIVKCGQSTRSTDSFSYRGYASIEIVNADWCQITGNKIVDPYSSGLVLDKSHSCNVEANHFHNSQGVTRSTTAQYFILMKGTADNLTNSTWNTRINGNTFDNGGENYAGQADELCYATYCLLNGYGYFDDHVQDFTNNNVVDAVILLAGRWNIDGNQINSTGVLDLSTSTSHGLPLLHLIGESAYNTIRNTTYRNTNASKSIGFVYISSANISSLVIHNCEIENTDYILYAVGGFPAGITLKNSHFTTITGVSNRTKAGNHYLDVMSCTGDRLADAPIFVFGSATAAISSPQDGDIIIDSTPRASGKIGWAYDGNAAAWKQFGVIDA